MCALDLRKVCSLLCSREHGCAVISRAFSCDPLSFSPGHTASLPHPFTCPVFLLPWSCCPAGLWDSGSSHTRQCSRSSHLQGLSCSHSPWSLKECREAWRSSPKSVSPASDILKYRAGIYRAPKIVCSGASIGRTQKSWNVGC